MPRRAMSHSERLGRQSSDAEYDCRRRLPRTPIGESLDDASVDTDAPAAHLSMARPLRHAKRWEKCRQIVLKRNPLCVDPYGWHAADGRVVLATQVDHITSLRERPDLAYTLENLQGLCSLCHNTKSQE